MATSRQLHFSTHAELKNVIGQDLINDDNIAVVELVKNGIDAGAKRVALSFLEETIQTSALKGPLIIVEDDGCGMSESDIINKWLNIAYSEKKARPYAGDRVLAGNKGVGRFACDRLGTRLDMFTRLHGGPLLHLEVDWSAFENKNETSDTIQKIRVRQHSDIAPAEVSGLIGRNMPPKGTMLVITGLRRRWDRDKLLHLKRTLQKFVNPIAVFDRGGVELTLEAPHELQQDGEKDPSDKVNGVVENQVFNQLKFKTTYVELQLSDDGTTLTTEIHHEGQRVYKLVEETDDFRPLQGVSVVIHYMNSYKKAYFKRQTGIHLVDFGSVFLFINGYRVPPYGDRDNDWLQLDNRKGQGTGRFLGTREILGLISISDPARLFRIVSNREGLVRNDAFSALTSRKSGLFFNALTRLERFVVTGLKWDTVPLHVRDQLRAGHIPGESNMPVNEIYEESQQFKRRRIALEVLRIVDADAARTRELEIDPDILDALAREREEDVQEILQRFGTFNATVVGHDVRLALGRVQEEFERQRAQLLRARGDASRRGRQVQRLKTVARDIAQRNVNLQRQLETQQTELLFSRVSSGSDQEQLLLLHHQSGIYAMTTGNFIEKGLTQLRQNNPSKAAEWFEKALNATRRVITVSKFATKANFRLKTELLTADIASFITEYLLNVAKDTSAQTLDLSVTRHFEEPFEMRFKPIDVAIVFDNVASNSTKAGAKRMSIKMTRPAENELEIKISDDGDGLSPEIQPPEKVFDRGVTTKENGSGLGLYHVRDTVRKMGGTIQLGEGPGFPLVIRLIK